MAKQGGSGGSYYSQPAPAPKSATPPSGEPLSDNLSRFGDMVDRLSTVIEELRRAVSDLPDKLGSILGPGSGRSASSQAGGTVSSSPGPRPRPGTSNGDPNSDPRSRSHRALNDMTDDEVLRRIAHAMGSVPRGFGRDQIARHDGRVDWAATNSAARMAKQEQDISDKYGGNVHYGRWKEGMGRREMADPGQEIAESLTKILPRSLADPVTKAFQRNRGWRDLGNAFGALGRDARDAGLPFKALAMYGGSVLSRAAGMAAIPGAFIGAAAAGAFGVASSQMGFMGQVAPFDAELVGEIVGLEVNRLGRLFDRSAANRETGSMLIRSRDFMEDALLPLQKTLDMMKNQIGTMVFGGVGFAANLVNDQLERFGIGSGYGIDPNQKNGRMIQAARLLGGAQGGIQAQMLGQMMQFGLMGAGAGAIAGGIGGFAIGGPVGAMIGMPLGALAGGAGTMIGASIAQQVFDLGQLGVAPNQQAARFRQNMNFIENTAPELATSLMLPALMSGIAGALGAFGLGKIGPEGFQEGFATVFNEGVEQFQEERDEIHGAWNDIFAGIAGGQMADPVAQGPVWDIGPNGMGNPIVIGGGQAGNPPMGRRRRRRRGGWMDDSRRRWRHRGENLDGFIGMPDEAKQRHFEELLERHREKFGLN